MIKQCGDCGKDFEVNKYAHLTRYCEICRLTTPMERFKGKHPEYALHASREYRKKNLELCRKRVRENQRILNNKKRFGGLRESVLCRDGYKCTHCSKSVKKPRSSAVHHENHNKKDNRMDNLTTLCHSCHALHHKEHSDKKTGRFLPTSHIICL